MTLRQDAGALIAALGGNPATGMCRCPAHDDANPSLRVTDGRKGVLVRCHAGCTQDAVIAALKARGLWGGGLGGTERIEPKRRTEDLEKDTQYLAYKILHSAALARLDRSAPTPAAYLRGRGIKVLPPAAMILPTASAAHYLGTRFPALVCPITDGKGVTAAHVTLLTRDGKTKCAAQTPRKIYGPLKAGYVKLSVCDPDQPLIIGEGIETTLSAMQISGLPGIAALSASNMPTIMPPRCAGVIIAADNDEPGRKAAAALAERLAYEGIKARVARPPVEGADWNDRLQAELDEKELHEEWQAALAAADPEAPAGPISALEEHEFMALAFAKRELLLEPWLPRAGLVMLHAPRGQAKTWLSLAVGKAVANGQDLLGWACPSYARVLYVDGELPGASLQDRLSKFRRSPPGTFHVLCRDTFHLRKQQMPDLGEAEGRQELDRIIEQCKPDLVILDSISTLVRSGVENEAESWAPVQAWLLKHRWQGRTVLLVHHENKTGRPRGTSKREDVLDTMIGLKAVDEGDAEDSSVYELSFTKARDFFGAAAEPLRIRLTIKEDRVEWTHETVKNVRVEKIRELRQAGLKDAEIAKELGLTKGRISQLTKKMREEDNIVKFSPRKEVPRGGDHQDEV